MVTTGRTASAGGQSGAGEGLVICRGSLGELLGFLRKFEGMKNSCFEVEGKNLDDSSLVRLDPRENAHRGLNPARIDILVSSKKHARGSWILYGSLS
jgi:hypothetical protein